MTPAYIGLPRRGTRGHPIQVLRHGVEIVYTCRVVFCLLYLASSFQRIGRAASQPKELVHLVHCAVALVVEFTLLPVRLEVAHLGAVLVVLVVLEGMLETALSALANEEQDE